MLLTLLLLLNLLPEFCGLLGDPGRVRKLVLQVAGERSPKVNEILDQLIHDLLQSLSAVCEAEAVGISVFRVSPRHVFDKDGEYPKLVEVTSDVGLLYTQPERAPALLEVGVKVGMEP